MNQKNSYKAILCIKFIMSSQTICCGCNIYKMAKIITGIEITLCFILSIPFLFQRLIGIQFHTDTLVEMGILWKYYLSLGIYVIYWAYIATEFIGIHKKVRSLIIFSCVIRVILSVLDGVIIVIFLCLGAHYWITDPFDRERILLAAIVIYLMLTLLIMIYLIFRTWIQFRVFYADSDNLTLNNTIELQLLRPV